MNASVEEIRENRTVKTSRLQQQNSHIRNPKLQTTWRYINGVYVIVY